MAFQYTVTEGTDGGEGRNCVARTDSSESSESERFEGGREPDVAAGLLGAVRRHPLAVFLVALVLSALCFQLPFGPLLPAAVGQEALLAAVALAGVALANPYALRVRSCGIGGLGPWMGYVLVVGLVAGAAPFFMGLRANLPSAAPVQVMQVAVLCLLTGVFEEGIFRVLAMDVFVPALGGPRRGLVRAAVASAVLFGVLHVSLGEASQAAGGVAALQVVLKPLQAGLFGFFLAALYARARNLWVLACLHGAFNFAYVAPSLLAGDLQQTYVTGDPLDLVLLAATVVLLIPPALRALRELREK